MSRRRRRNDDIVAVHHPVERKLLCSTHLRQFKHHIFPGLNLHREDINLVNEIDDAVSFYQKPPAVIRKPLPCLSSSHVATETFAYNHDCVLKLVKDKVLWKNREKRWITLARTALKDKKVMKATETLLKKNLPVTTLPYVITRLADHAANDPDEHFQGVYNWYYGNALCCSEVSNTSCLLYAGGEHLNKLCFSTYERSSSSHVIPQVSPLINISLADDGPIFDIVSHKENGTIGVRQRNYCYFFLYDNTDEEIAINRCLKVKCNDHPFVSMDVSDSEFCTLNTNREVKFWVPQFLKTCMGVAPLSGHDSYLPDKFGQVKYCLGSNSQQFAVIDRRKLYFYDKRKGYHSPTSVWDPEDITEMCENLSLLVPSLVDGYWYLGMSHTCLLFDARAGFAQKWTHMLPQAPSVGCLQRINKEKYEPKEYLILATQASNDIVAIHNQWTGGSPKSDVLPIYVPNRIDTLHEARTNGILGDISFTNKFSRSLIGLSGYKKKKRMGIFSLVSTGDIFHQSVQINKNRPFWNSENNVKLCQQELNHLKAWETDYMEHFEKRKPILKITRLVDLSVVPECANLINPIIPDWSLPDLSGRAPWKKSKKTLESYQDFLTPHIMQDFGMDVESEWGSDSESEDVPEKVQPTGDISKVSKWLAAIDPDPNFQEEDIQELFKNEQEQEEEEEDLESFELSISSNDSVGGMSRTSRMSYLSTL